MPTSTGPEDQFCGLGEVEEIGHNLAQFLGLFADALHIGPEIHWQPLQIEQSAVAVDCRQTVPELVRNARRKLAETREAVLQAQLILEIGDFAQIGEQADRAMFVAAVVANG